MYCIRRSQVSSFAPPPIHLADEGMPGWWSDRASHNPTLQHGDRSTSSMLVSCLLQIPITRVFHADSKRRGDSYQRKSTPDASVLGLGGSAVPSLGGGAMNLASCTSRWWWLANADESARERLEWDCWSPRNAWRAQ